MIIFSIVAAFVILAVVVFLIFWCKRKRAEKKLRRDQEIINATEREEEDGKLTHREEKIASRGHNETTAMGLKGEGSHVMNHPSEASGSREHFEDEKPRSRMFNINKERVSDSEDEEELEEEEEKVRDYDIRK